MKKKIERISTVGMSREEWKKYQLLRIGGSSAGAVLGLNPYMSALELFHLYIGTIPQQEEEAESAFHGRQLEDYVARCWMAWDGTIPGMIRNFESGVKHQLCKKVNAILVHPDYPWLHANVDREIIRCMAGKKGVLEIKTINSFASDKWEGGVPPSYIIQIQQYMLLFEKDYAELAMLKSGGKIEVFSFERDQDLIEGIVGNTKKFWMAVEFARQTLASDMPEHQKQATIAQLEPEPDGSDACEEFLKKRYQKAALGKVIDAEMEHIEWAQKYNRAQKNMKRWEAIKTEFANRFRLVMGDAEKIDFGMAGYVSWRNDKTGKRKFEVKVKEIVNAY